MNKWTEEEKALFHKLWESNYTIEQIAIELNRPKDSVRGFADRQKLEPRDYSGVFANYNVKQNRNWFRDEIEDPPKEIPLPENSLNIPWIELNNKQCQFGTSNDFYEPAGNRYICCGLPVQGGRGVRNRFCEFHVIYALKEKK